MKKAKSIFYFVLMTFSVLDLFSQECITCDGNTVNLNNDASAIGNDNQSTGVGSLAFGFNNISDNSNTVSIGKFLKATSTNSMVIGSGLSDINRITNSTDNSLMIGFSSNLPTFFVGGSNGTGKTGRIGIGTISPNAKLHIKSDYGEAAVVFIQPFAWSINSTASIWLGSSSNNLTAKLGEGLIFNIESGNYVFNNGFLKLTKEARKDYVLTCSDDYGTAKWMPVPEVSQWTDNGNNIFFNTGSVGIGTINTYGYALAVEGKILTDEVMVKDPSTWYDYVLKEGYKLRSLHELELFIKQNHHLPDVPSEKEVIENGYGLAEMNGILLKKVEELTLYVIEQQKVLEAQQTELEKIKDQLNY